MWGAWATMVLAALLFVARFGSATPFGDDWELTAALTGEQPVTLRWLWAQHNEHRIFVPRLVMLAAYRATGFALRAPMFLDVLLLAAGAAVLILAARAVRGRTRYTDAFFPLVLLHWGQAENLLWNFQVGFVLPVVLLLIVLAVVVRGQALRGRPREGVVAGACLLLISLCGAMGVIWPPVLAAWVLLAALPMLRSADRAERRAGAALLVLPAAAVLAAGLYFVGYQRPGYHPLPPGVRAVLRTALQTWGMMFGVLPGQRWPLTAAAAVVVALLAAAPPLWLLARAARGGAVVRHPEAPRAAGLLATGAGLGPRAARARCAFRARPPGRRAGRGARDARREGDRRRRVPARERGAHPVSPEPSGHAARPHRALPAPQPGAAPAPGASAAWSAFR